METGVIPMHNKYRQYDRSPRGKSRASKRNTHKRDARELEYRTRPFIAWDGEGITEPDGSHTYFLLANSLGDSITNRDGLSTVECLDLFLSRAKENGIHVVYGGSYDVNMMMRDIDHETVARLYAGETVSWQGYRLRWRDGKSLQMSRNRQTVTLYDVSPFFQCSFVKACDEYLGDDWEAREQIVREKANRGTFQWEHAAEVESYNRAELRNLVRLCSELRDRLFKVGIRIRRWDGPGAIAAALLTQYGVRDHMGEVPETVASLARYAYAGGRFECIRYGHSERPAYQYDIRSAYPSAMRSLPCLTHGSWEHVTFPSTVEPFGIYHCIYNQEWSDPCWTKPQPLFIRNRNGTVSWPLESVQSWYWSPEAQLAIESGGHILEGWVWNQTCDEQPFAFVEPLYNKRAALKKANDGAHVGLKLGLNSLYGKLVQQVGWSREKDGTVRKPPFHCLEWGGYVTSHCRAQVYRAALTNIHHVIAFETDAIFSRVPLDLPLGTRLGEWELTEYESLTYVKSGMYYGTLRGGGEVVKSRGIDKDSLPRAEAIRMLSDVTVESVSARQTRFIGAGLAGQIGMDKWRRWITSDRAITSPHKAFQSKRIPAMTNEHFSPYAGTDSWHETWPGWQSNRNLRTSYPYQIRWLDEPLTAEYDDAVDDARDHRGLDSTEWGTT